MSCKMYCTFILFMLNIKKSTYPGKHTPPPKKKPRKQNKIEEKKKKRERKEKTEKILNARTTTKYIYM